MSYMLSNNAIEHDRRFIKRTLGSEISTFWLAYFCFITGVGALVGTFTVNLYWSASTVLLTCIVALWLWYSKVGVWRPFIGIALMGCLIVAFITICMHLFPYNASYVSTFWLINKRTLWIGRQVNFGLILGSLTSFICGALLATSSEALGKKDTGGYLVADEGTLDGTLFGGLIGGIIGAWILWLIVGTIALLFNWGFGWGAGWYISCFLSIPVGVAHGSGLAVFIYITLKWYKPSWLYNTFRNVPW